MRSEQDFRWQTLRLNSSRAAHEKRLTHGASGLPFTEGVGTWDRRDVTNTKHNTVAWLYAHAQEHGLREAVMRNSLTRAVPVLNAELVVPGDGGGGLDPLPVTRFLGNVKKT